MNKQSSKEQQNTENLIKLGEQLKKEGFNVYIEKEITEEEKDTYQYIYYRQWMYVSNGKRILSISFNDFGFWQCSFQYVPNKENGTACELLSRDTIELTVDMIKTFLNIDSVGKLCCYNHCIKHEFIKFYKDEKDWFDKLWSKERFGLL